MSVGILVPERSSSPDVIFGAYLMDHLIPKCENCGLTDTPQWRKGWYSDVLGRSVLLCNKCGLKYHKNQYCPYCHFVYGKELDRSSQEWLSCKQCGRVVHMACEVKRGKFSADDPVYRCPECKVRRKGSG